MIEILTDTHATAFQNIIIEAYENEPLTFIHECEYDCQSNNEQSIQFLHPDNHKNSIVFGAFIDDTLVGIVQLDYIQHPTKKHKATVQSLYVTPNHRGNTLGHQLIQTLIQHAKNDKIEQLILAIASNNIQAKVFFNQFGFEFLATEEAARKVNDCYIEEHWLIYNIGG